MKFDGSGVTAIAAGVQAAAAVAALAITFVLARLTARYVALTETLAGAGREQLALMREQFELSKARQVDEVRQNRQSLRAVASRLLNAIGNITKSEPAFDELQRLDLDRADIRQLELLVRDLGVAAIREAGIAAAGLQRMEALAEKVKQIPVGQGWAAGRQEMVWWNPTILETIRALAAVFSILNAADEADAKGVP